MEGKIIPKEPDDLAKFVIDRHNFSNTRYIDVNVRLIEKGEKKLSNKVEKERKKRDLIINYKKREYPVFNKRDNATCVLRIRDVKIKEFRKFNYLDNPVTGSVTKKTEDTLV